MAVTISLALLFGLLLIVLIRSGSLKAGGAFVAVMFGFYLASTGASHTVNALMSALVAALPNL
ncbi:hypothetical protein ACWCQW_40835 [Streptomyces mirabilis]|jgi:hypothetical protein|uniref:hypothetical protein n=1 Tax=Streptomyces sp. Ag82_O1-15 TaxID=1938855 RepID=UPI000BB0E636|nr:hypothetical protein [Streptomyces sp. Ag82_O1-15]PBC96170.1 hypothetical protein BX281_4159 [Streptomyces sp. Ag82_O1-15]PBC96192.1 hypothetical protein BX281_4183 [Streptomyces sp. Ag82_O1-15]